MAKQATLTTITSTNNNASTLNTNFAALNAALLNTLSLDGSTPNAMSADLDLNSYDLLNVQDVNTQRLYIAGVLVNSVGNLANWQGDWVTATAYSAYDLVYVPDNNAIYRCITGHTSGTFATDLSNSLWEVYIGNGLINQAAVALTGGTIDNIVIGSTTAAAATVTDLTATGTVDFSGISNAADVRTNDLEAAALGANEFTGTQDFNGQQVEGHLTKVVTGVTGTLTTTDHSGNTLVTTGNVTVPTTAGFNAIIVAGGAHTVTFNSLTSAAMAAGDVMTVVVESGTVIHAVLVAAADKVTFS